MDTKKDNILEQSKTIKSPISLPVIHNNCSLTLICRHNKCLPCSLICFYFEFFLLLSELLRWRRNGRLESYCFVLVVVRIAGQTLCHWTGLSATTPTMHWGWWHLDFEGKARKRRGSAPWLHLAHGVGTGFGLEAIPSSRNLFFHIRGGVSFVTRWNPERLVVHTPKPWGNLALLFIYIFFLH